MKSAKPLRFLMPRLLSLLVPTGLMLVACSSPAESTATSQPTEANAAEPTTRPQPTSVTAEFDQMFIDMMVPHHQSAIEMAMIAQERAEHSELKEMASQVIEDQQQEVEQLQSWRRQWFGSGDTPPMSQMPMLPDMMMDMDGQMMMDMASSIEQLQVAPEPFDQHFIDMMIGHHQMAIEAARLAQQQATRPEIRDTAQQIIEKQQAEIDQLKQWRQQWYGSAEPEPTPIP